MRQGLRRQRHPAGAALLGLASILGVGCHLSVGSSGSDRDDAGSRACGSRTCGAGTECCNASCGICAPPGNFCIALACDPVTMGMTCADLDCESDETCMQTFAGPQCVPHADNPCLRLSCPPNATCEVAQGAASCVLVGGATPDGGGVSTDAGSSGADAAITADASTPGLDAGTPRADASVPPDDATTTPADAGPPRDTGVIVHPPGCATVLCPAGTYCEDTGEGPKCRAVPSCSTKKCDPGYRCELMPVQCITAPCYPVPTCVPNPTDPCEGRCKPGQQCQVNSCSTADRIIPCKVAPPICLPSPSPACGASVCEEGQLCCNASCGLCAPRGAACTQLVCPAPVSAL